MRIKRLFTLALTAALAVSMLAGCGKGEQKKEAEVVRIASMKGPTSMGLVHLYNDVDNQAAHLKYEYSIVGSADEINPKLISGELDVAAVPANVASVLWNKTNGGVQVLAINTLGVLYIVEKNGETVTDIASLKGKTIVATGKGATPEASLAYILKANGLDIDKDVTVEWKSEASEVVSYMATQDSAIALLPQPYVTVAQAQLSDLRVAIDLNQPWNSASGKQMVTGVLVARTEFVKNNPNTVKTMLEEMQMNSDKALNDKSATAALIAQYGIVAKAPIAEKALPNCNLVFIKGSVLEDTLSSYLKTLYDFKSQLVGGNLPDGTFYYTGK